MIEFAKTFISNGKSFVKLDEAKAHELASLFPSLGDGGYSPGQIAIIILNKSEEVIDALTLTAKSHPKGRAINGAKRTRKPAAPATPAVAPITTVHQA